MIRRRPLPRNKEDKRNFLTYAYDAARIMNDSGIKNQVKDHRQRLREEIAQPLEPREERVRKLMQRRRMAFCEQIVSAENDEASGAG